ncbi:twin-arginine translocase subunit TatC [Fluviispira multicolorata]|uniref:Sec-independent protein translocase protein TatC n=1 Tax=Fluviispira multicolorata TaxID=2654512 RepID=A0A833JEJ9_9BACT|nr:twin-arginine translocase subunit TatC [Fluviispira multicolorata]KAB8033246.1 twin-arginine translocase subunit TatC [Fluviispira multicolorata]
MAGGKVAMASTGFRPIQYISSAFNAALQRKAKREQEVSGNKNEQMTLFEHIQDLRKHALRGTIWLIAFSGISFIFMEHIIFFLKRPYDSFLLHAQNLGIQQNLSSIGIFEVMTMNFKICFLVGFVTSLPFLVREMWKFISPALYAKERNLALFSLTSSVILFYSGMCFGFFLIIPYFFKEALSWSSKYASIMITYDSYFSSLITLMLIFAAVFEVPVFLSLLGLAGILPSEALIRNRKIAFLACFIIGAILSPPEVISQCLVALPMYFMVEVSIFIIKKIEKSRQQNIIRESSNIS